MSRSCGRNNSCFAAGGGLAQLAAQWAAVTWTSSQIRCITFGAPPVGLSRPAGQQAFRSQSCYIAPVELKRFESWSCRYIARPLPVRRVVALCFVYITWAVRRCLITPKSSKCTPSSSLKGFLFAGHEQSSWVCLSAVCGPALCLGLQWQRPCQHCAAHH